MPESSTISQNLGVIRQAQRGSDVYGVLEKIAFILFLNKVCPTPEQNWFYAQNILAKWEIYARLKTGWGYDKVLAKLPDDIRAQLEKNAWGLCSEKYHKIGAEEQKAGRNPSRSEILARINPNENWFKAMHNLAHEIIYGSTYC